MNKKAISALEFNKITEMLCSHAASPGGLKLCRKIKPLHSIDDIRSALKNTSDAVSRILRNGRITFGANADIGECISRLDLGGSLSMGELYKLGAMLSLAENAKKYGMGAKSSDEPDSLTPYFSAIEPCVLLKTEINRCILSENEISDYASSDLLKIRRAQKANADRIHTSLNSLLNGSLRSYLQDNVITMRNDRYCVPVKSEYRSQVQGLIHDQSSSGSTLFIEPMSVVKLNNEIKKLKLDEEAEIAVILAALSAEAAEKAEQIKNNIHILNELDFIFAKAALSIDMKASEPEFNEEGHIELKSARHPLIDKRKVVPISLTLGYDYDLLVITGPNTGGKTVTLKTVGLLSMMGQSGLHIPAFAGSVLSVFDEIYADIGDEQSIEQSLSTFSSHMTNVISILEHSTERSLVLLDELGSGTDPVEGAALAISILEELHASGARTIATTHYSELKIFALTSPGVENAGCEFDVETLKPTYRLITGTPGKSNAFEITRKLGMPKRVIENASGHIDKRDENFEDVIISLEKKRKDLENRIKENEALSEELSKREEKLRERESHLSEKKGKQLEDARSEAYEVLREAKEYADEAIKRLRKAENSHKDMRALERERSNINRKLKDALDARTDGAAAKNTGILSPKDISIGDEVRIISMDLKGTVGSLPDAKGNLFVNTGIIRTKTNIKDLEKLDEDKKYGTMKEKVTGSGNMIYRKENKHERSEYLFSPDKSTRNTKYSEIMRARSASHNMKFRKSMSVSGEINLLGKTVDEAVLILDKYLDDACMAGFPEVRIIHGKGTGALRRGIHDFLKTWPGIEFSLAPYGEGDAGVTIVRFK